VHSDRKGGERNIPALSLLTKAEPLHSKSKGQNESEGEQGRTESEREREPDRERASERERGEKREKEIARREEALGGRSEGGRSDGEREERERAGSPFCTTPLKQPAGEVIRLGQDSGPKLTRRQKVRLK